ncbi:MAG: DUF4296 domain-containing protein [Bacteroidota bacterium]
MKKFFLTTLVIVSACTTRHNAPKDLIAKEQMVLLMTEIHLLESKIKNLNIRPKDSANLVYQHYENLLFTDFNITKDQYEKSFNYYIDNLDEFKKVYDAVVDTLMQKEKLAED